MHSFANPIQVLNIIKVFGLFALGFVVAVALTPVLTHYLYKYKAWKKKPRKSGLLGKTPIFYKLHKKREISTPRMGGLLIWVSCLILASVMSLLAFSGNEWLVKFNFLSRSQTWLLLFILVAAGIIGFIDDFLSISKKQNQGFGLKWRIIIILMLGTIGAYWLYCKLGWNAIHIPYFGDFTIGWIYVPLFILTMLALFGGTPIDGLDGLAGGTMASSFGAYAGLAFARGQIDIATFCAVIVGTILAFLWFNIPPARFYMGETGMISLTTTLTVVAFLTDSVAVLLIIAFPLFATSGSIILQVIFRKFFKKKLFRVAPLHHHFEAIGWPHYKITMRYWVVSVVLAVIGMVIGLIGQG